jgi:ubiquinone/menaquinone biosynthesis C-methylase UbiE
MAVTPEENEVCMRTLKMIAKRFILAGIKFYMRIKKSIGNESSPIEPATPAFNSFEEVSPNTSNSQLSAKAWSFLTDEELVKRRERINWSGIGLNHRYYNYLVHGNPDLHYLVYFMNKYIKKPGRVLSLGCGNGHLERVLVNFNLPYTEILGMDINPDLMTYASQEAAKLGYKNLKYVVADLNNVALPKNSFDLVIFFHSLHHIENLEGMLQNVKNTLTNDGLILVVDFIGPTRFQWTDRQIQLTQQLLDILPDELKIDLHNPIFRETKKEISRPTIDEIIRTDPSESVRSGEILNLLCKEFDVLEQKPMGGTLLSLLFDGIAGNFDEQNPFVCALIRSLQKTEELLITNQVIPPDYIFMVLRRNQ